jgi:hypothetical protein
MISVLLNGFILSGPAELGRPRLRLDREFKRADQSTTASWDDSRRYVSKPFDFSQLIELTVGSSSILLIKS